MIAQIENKKDMYANKQTCIHIYSHQSFGFKWQSMCENTRLVANQRKHVVLIVHNVINLGSVRQS